MVVAASGSGARCKLQESVSKLQKNNRFQGLFMEKIEKKTPVKEAKQ